MCRFSGGRSTTDMYREPPPGSETRQGTTGGDSEDEVANKTTKQNSQESTNRAERAKRLVTIANKAAQAILFMVKAVRLLAQLVTL